jgi:polysaccharide biosynthesis/export protein
MKILRTVFLFTFSLYFISCGTQKKVPPPYYLDHVNDTTPKSQVKVPELRIQKDDWLSIQVISASTAEKVDALYNLPVSGGSTNSPLAGGFLVDVKGNIEYPRLGTIRAEGLTKQELADVIKKKLTTPVEVLRDPTVIIRFLNYKITVLGQVGREGVLTIPGEKVTVLEAIGLAGGITDYGKKDRIKVLREVNGEREVGYVDLTSDKLFESPYYNLLQNDVLFIEPTKQKQKLADQNQTTQRISLVLSIITAAALIYNIFK